MAEAEIMAEEMQSPKKVAFANRKYTNEEKRKMEEEELEQLFIKGSLSNYYERILSQILMIFDRPGSEGGLFLFLGKK